MKAALLVMLAFLIGAAACSERTEAIRPAGTLPQVPPASANAAGAPPHTRGRVIETMDAGRYTYLQVDDGETRVWAAAPKFEVAVGDDVIMAEGTAMRDHYSKTLDRTFDVVYFVAFAAVASEGSEAPIPSGPGDAVGESRAREIDFSGIERAEGGKTVAELFDEGGSLAGQDVTVRGRVVKVNRGVMGKNWIHLQDGTTSTGGANDLTVTSEEIAEVGDTVLVRGVVSANRDFGFGYKYDVMIEEATVAVE
jgi:hypothetical protein